MAPDIGVLTDRKAASLKPRDTRYAIADGKVPGLLLAVHPTGKKTWAIYSRVRGRRIKLTLGSYPTLGVADARALATDRLRLIAKGIDPREAERERRDNTFASVVDRFIETYAKPRNRSWRETEQILRRYAVPVWGNWPIRDIERRHVAALIDATAKDAPADALRLRAVLHRLFNWALERDLVVGNPVAGVRPPVRPRVRERTLNDAEIKAVWQASEKAGYPFGPFVQLLLLTALRRGELATARWADIDRSQALLIIPGDRYKTGKPHAVPLTPLAMEIIEALPVVGGTYLFTTTGDRPISGFSKMLERLIEASGVVFAPHDLRRTVRTNLSRLGVDFHVAERVLGHVQSGVSVHYDHHGYLAEKRRALEAWERHVRTLIDGASAENVVRLPGR